MNEYYEEIRRLAEQVETLDKDMSLEELALRNGTFSILGDSDVIYFIKKGIKTIFDDYSLSGVVLEGKTKVHEDNIFEIFLYVYKNLETGEEGHGFEIVFYELLTQVPKDPKYDPQIVTIYNNSTVHGRFQNLEEAKEYAKRALENI